MRMLDQDTYLKALALATMASDFAVRAREIQLAAGRLLGLDDGSHVDDAIYRDSQRISVAEFDEALEREGLSREPAPTSQD